jgi:hypothetical protein
VADRETFGKKMSGDPFGLPPKKKLIAYACTCGAILCAGCSFFIYQGVPLWRVLLLVGAAVVVGGGFIVGMIWISGGKRSEVPVGPAGVRPPIRMMKALPYAFALLALFYLLKLIEVIR